MVVTHPSNRLHPMTRIHKAAQNTLVRNSNSSLPTTVRVSVPAGLDWVVRHRLTQITAQAVEELPATAYRRQALVGLNQALHQGGRSDIYEHTLWGGEVGVLYSFLLEQERSFISWSSATLPVKAVHTVRAQLRGLLPKLHALCRGVDIGAHRPAPVRY